MKVKDEWLDNEKAQEERNELFEEMYQHSKEGEFAIREQLDSDLEDLREELKEVTHERDRLLQQIEVLYHKYNGMWDNK